MEDVQSIRKREHPAVEIVVDPGRVDAPHVMRFIGREFNRELRIEELDAQTLSELKAARDAFDDEWTKVSASLSLRIARRENELSFQIPLFGGAA